MAKLWYPPDFAEWPRDARVAWFDVHANREQVVRQFRRAAGVEDPDRSVTLSVADCAAAVEKLSAGERIIGVTNSRRACLAALFDEAGMDGDPEKDWVTKNEIAELAAILRGGTYPTCPKPIGDMW